MELEEFGERMEELARQVPGRVARLIKKVSGVVLEHIVRGTPADVGTARSNWIVSLNGTSDEVVPAYAPGKKLGASESGNADVAIAVGKGVLRGVVNLSQEVHVQNNLPYIERLNDGWSEQAPAAFVESAIIAGSEDFVERELIDG